MPESAIDLVQQQTWLDGAVEPLTKLVHGAYESFGDAGQRAKNAMHGTWLRHPLHPALTDIPIGAWTTAAVLDASESLTGDRGYGRAADVAMGLGLVGALGAAATGLTDWSETDGEAKRLGLFHGILNLTATTLCASSLVLRRGGDRAAGRAAGLAGLALAYVASYFGGALVYRERVGVSHANPIALDRPSPALPSDSLGEGEKRCVEVNGEDVMVTRQHGQVCALAEHCSHLGGPLSEGTLKNGSIVCPWHASEFGLDDGRVINGPATQPQPHYATTERDGAIILENRT
jgi:nitrite reductase/ring-hydroxylating ferredoxin subunit/uncharacterized membrane protein